MSAVAWCRRGLDENGETTVLLDLVATLCAGGFAGAASYVTLVEHPARVAYGPELAIVEFGPSYRRGTIMQASLAGLGFAAAAGAWHQGSGLAVLTAGLLLGAVVPFTVVVVVPTNKRLLDPTLDRRSHEAVGLLHKSGRLHAVRTVASAAAFVILVWHLAH